MICLILVLRYGCDRIPHDIPITLAVSPLSPVSIHVLMPAYLNYFKQGSTSIYNKSSTPVTASKVSPDSISY